MRRSIKYTAAIAVPLLVVTASASPLMLYEKNVELAKKDSCAGPTYTVITPSPGASPTPVTRQFQDVSSCVPEYVVCNAATPTDCHTVYSTTYYQWVSTVVPCYNGVCTMTDANQPLTIANHPSYTIETATCQAGSKCVVGEDYTYVAAATQIPYVAPINNYYVCPYSDYSSFTGVGDLGVEVQSCYNGVCAVYPLNIVYSVHIVTNYVSYPINVETYCPSNTVIVIGNGGIGVTITISDAPTHLSTVIDGTSTVTSTKTVTTTKSVTKAVTVTKTTTATGTGATNIVGAAFVLEANIVVAGRKRAVDKSYLSFQNGQAGFVASCTNAATLNINAAGQIVGDEGTVFASTADVSDGIGELQIGSGSITTGFSFDGQSLRWKNAAFDGDHTALFCVSSQGLLTVLFSDNIAHSDCTIVTINRIDPTMNSFCLGAASTSSSVSGANNVNTRTRRTTSTTGSSTTNPITTTGTSSTGTETSSSISGNDNVNTRTRRTTTTSDSSSSSVTTTDISDSSATTTSSKTGTDTSSSSTATDSSSSSILSSTTVGSSSSTTSATTTDGSSSGTTTTTSGATDSTTSTQGTTGSITTTQSTASTTTSTSTTSTPTSNSICIGLNTPALIAECDALTFDPCTQAGIVNVNTDLQAPLIALCTNNISPAVKACLADISGGSTLTTLGDCLQGVLTLGNTLTGTCLNLAAGLPSLCIATGGDPCTDASSLVGLTTAQQTVALGLCANTLSPALDTCSKILTDANALVTLGDCISSVAKIGTGANTLCTGLSTTLAAVCLTDNEANPCADMSLVNTNLTPAQQTSLVTVCASKLSTAATECVNGIVGQTTITLAQCLQGVVNLGTTIGTVCNAAVLTNPLQLAQCIVNGGTSTGTTCTDQAFISADTTGRTNLLAVCAGKFSPALQACITGTTPASGVTLVTTLDSCLAGIVSANGAIDTLCPASTITNSALLAACISAGSLTGACGNSAVAALNTSPTQQSALLTLCAGNLTPALQTCNTQAAAGTSNTFGINFANCLNGLISLGSTVNTVCDPTSFNNNNQLLALCIQNAANPCTTAGIVNVQATLQSNVIGLCPNNINSALESCVSGTGAGALTTLSSCISGVASLNAAGGLSTACTGASSVGSSVLKALCLANGGVDPCSANSLVSLSASTQSTTLGLCTSYLGPAVAACAASTTVNLNTCLNGIISLGGESAADAKCGTTLTASPTLGVTCLVTGLVTCAGSTLATLSLTTIVGQVASCLAAGLLSTSAILCNTLNVGNAAGLKTCLATAQ